MSSIIKNLIEYSGLADEIPEMPNPSCFKQFTISQNLILPDSKPNIKQIIKVMNQSIVKDTSIIKMPEAISEKSQALTGKKIIVEGELMHKLEYEADIPSRALHAVYFSYPFCSSIALPKNCKQNIPVTVTVYIQDISVQLSEERKLFSSALIFLSVEY